MIYSFKEQIDTNSSKLEKILDKFIDQCCGNVRSNPLRVDCPEEKSSFTVNFGSLGDDLNIFEYKIITKNLGRLQNNIKFLEYMGINLTAVNDFYFYTEQCSIR